MTDKASEINESKPKETQNIQPPKSSSTGKTCCIIAAIIILAIILFIASFFFRYWLGLKVTNTPKTSTTQTYGGNWRLDMTQTSTTTGIETLINTQGSGAVSFQMPASEGQKFTSSGDWSSQGEGTVGPSTETANITGKINVNGEIVSGKLHFGITYTEQDCPVTLSTPLGTSTVNNCDPNSLPDLHEIDIEIKDEATATSTVTKNYGNYNYSGTEYWTLVKL